VALKVEDAWKESGSEALLASEFRSINLYRSLTLVHFPHYLVHGDRDRTLLRLSRFLASPTPSAIGELSFNHLCVCPVILYL